ncbi:MAG TPA: A/G-specific adenine glycosylase [Verrucomicrobiae bacterium]|jgi:A/G-specific adenine glycosylase|nr:A/G-specific adenine glycosylase [Verrucomicrobiae bacterium]
MPRAQNSTLDPRLSTLPRLLLSWFAQNARDLPWRRTCDPYAIWVSEIMLQQTQVKTVIPYWERWMRELPTIESLAKANPDKIHKLWEGLGYYTRVRNMQKAAQEIVAESRRRGNESQIKSSRRIGTHVISYAFPNKFEDILALPGIGRYTAGAICSIAFNQPTPILDGNVIRVLTRVFGIKENPREKNANALLWNLAGELVIHASRFTFHALPCSHLNQSLMELGALICNPREPKCLVCPIAKHCFAFQNNRIVDFPNLEKRATPTARRFAAFVVEDRGKFLVRQRPAGVVNAHLWEFPNIELNGEPLNPDLAARELLGFAAKDIKPLCTIKHSITRYRITVEAFRAAAPPALKVGQSCCRSAPSSRHARPARDESLWLPVSELHKLSFPSAHKKILEFVSASV